MTEVTKMRSPHAMGDDHPAPGTSVFQKPFLVELQVSGRPASSATPTGSGPRNCGQRSVAAAAPEARTIGTANRMMGTRSILTLPPPPAQPEMRGDETGIRRYCLRAAAANRP